MATAIEKVINTALRYDPGSQVALAELEDCTFAIESTSPRLNLCFRFGGQEVSVFSHWEDEVDCRLRGPLPKLLQLVNHMSRPTLAHSGVEVIGNSTLLAKLLTIVRNLDIDWEEPLDDWLGDVIGHPLAQAIRQQMAWVKSRTDKAQGFFGDYLTEELRAVPSAPELAFFCQQVDEARSACDRLAARIERLSARISRPAPQNGATPALERSFPAPGAPLEKDASSAKDTP